jgi:hypothetical protein
VPVVPRQPPKIPPAGNCGRFASVCYDPARIPLLCGMASRMLQCEELRARAPQPPPGVRSARATHNARACPALYSQGAGHCNPRVLPPVPLPERGNSARERAARTCGWLAAGLPPQRPAPRCGNSHRNLRRRPSDLPLSHRQRLLFPANLLRFRAFRSSSYRAAKSSQMRGVPRPRQRCYGLGYYNNTAFD